MDTSTKSFFKNPVLDSLVLDFEKYYDENLKYFDNDELLYQPSLEESNFGEFLKILNGIENIAAFHLNEVVLWLIEWYQGVNKIPTRQAKSLENFPITIRESLPTINNGISDTSFLLCLRGCLRSCEHQLETNLTKKVLALTYKILKDFSFHVTNDTKRENFNYISELASTLLDALSSKNLSEIEKIFYMEHETASSSAIRCIIIQSLSNLRIRVFSVDHVEGVFKILTVLSSSLSKTKEKDLRFAYINVLSRILTEFSSVAKTELNIPIVKNVVSSLTTKANDFLKKVRYQLVTIPLASALLCCSTKTTFLNSYFSMATTLIQFSKSKDHLIAGAALQCLERVVSVYVLRYESENREKSLKFFNFLNSNLYATPRNINYTEFSQILINIAALISISQQDFAMNTIIREMCQPATTKHFCPDRMSLGLRIFIYIMDTSPKKKMSGFLPVYDGFYQTNRFSTIKKVVSDKKSWQKSDGDPVKSQIIESFFGTLWHLDSLFGRPYLQTNPTSAHKFSNEVNSGEKKTKFQLLKQCIASLPKFLVSENVLEDLTEMLSRLTLHVDEDMQNHSTAALKLLLLEYPVFGSRIFQSIVNTYLSEIPSSCPDVSYKAMINLFKFVQIWRTCLSNETFEICFQDGFSAIEGFCLINLCSTLETHRSIVCQILKESKNVHSILIQKNTMEKSVYEEIYRFLVEKYSLKFEGYANIELMNLFDQTFSNTPWFQILSIMFRDSQLSYNCSSAIEFARVNGYIKFLSSHMFIESMTNLVDTTSSRLSLGRTKKLPNFCDTQIWQNYFTIFCAPPLFYEKNMDSEKPLKPPSALNVLKSLEKATTLIKTDYPEINDLCCDVLSYTHATVVPLMLDAFSPLFQEISERGDISSKKKKRKDAMALRILNILSKISENGHFVKFVNYVGLEILKPVVIFCEICRYTLVYSPDINIDSLLNLSTLISAICYGLHQSNRTLLFSPSNRELHYKTFVEFHKKCSKDSKKFQDRLIPAIFGLFCAQDLLSNPDFSIPISDALQLIDFLLENKFSCNSISSYQISLIDTIEALLLYNEYINDLVEWIFKHIYNSYDNFSRLLFFVMLNYFEKKYLGKSDIDLLPVYSSTSIYQCQEAVFNHILTNSFQNYPQLLSELFQILQICDFAFRQPILYCLTYLLPRISLKNHPDLEDVQTISFIPEAKDNISILTVDFSLSVMLVNNLLYTTWKFDDYHAIDLRKCWSLLSSVSNQNLNFILSYISAIAHFDYPPLHNLIKIVSEYISFNNANSFCEFLSNRLMVLFYNLMKFERNSRLRVYPIKKYPFVSLSQFFYTQKDSQEQNLFSLKSLSSENNNIFYCLSFNEILQGQESLSTLLIIFKFSHACLLIIASHVIPFSTIDLDDSFFTFLHLSGNEIFSSNEILSNSCKNLIISLCTIIINRSNINECDKLTFLNEINSLSYFLKSSKDFRAFSLPKNSLIKDDSVINRLKTILKSILPVPLENDPSCQNGNEQLLYTLLKCLLNYLEFFNCLDICRWSSLCVHFATESASLNIACYSLFVLRTIVKKCEYEYIKRLAVAYCVTSQDFNTEPKKLAYELLMTIHSIGISMIRAPFESDFETIPRLLSAFLWVFAYSFSFELPIDPHFHFSFFTELFTLSKNIIDEILSHLDKKTHNQNNFLFLIANLLITFPSYQEQGLFLALNFGSFCSHTFVSPDPILGNCLISLLLAYFFIDFFDSPLDELSRGFTQILDKMELIPSLISFYNVFNMFRPACKRRDVSLFLEMLALKILDISNSYHITFFIKFFSDVVSLNEFRCLRNGLLLLNAFICQVGPNFIPLSTKDFLMEKLPIFLKKASLCRISLELSEISFSISEPNLCPHQYYRKKIFLKDFVCEICHFDEPSPDYLKWILNDSFFKINLSDTFELNIFTFFDSQGSRRPPREVLLADMPLDYDIRIEGPEPDTQPIDCFSVNSSQMIDDLIETINFLDQHFEGTMLNKINKNTTKRHPPNVIRRIRAQTLKIVRPSHFTRSHSHDVDNSIKDSFVTKFCSESRLDRIIDDSYTSIKFISDNETSQKSFSGFQCFDHLSFLSLYSNSTLYESWISICNDSYQDGGINIIPNLSRINELISILFYHLIWQFESMLKEYCFNIHILTIQSNPILKKLLLNLEKLVYNFFTSHQFPYFVWDKTLIIQSPNELISLLIRISSAGDTFLSNQFLLKKYLNGGLTITKNLLISLTQRNSDTPSKLTIFNFENLSQKSNIEKEFLDYLLFDSVKWILDILDLYGSYFGLIKFSLKNLESKSITNSVLNYKKKYKNDIELNIFKYLSDKKYHSMYSIHKYFSMTNLSNSLPKYSNFTISKYNRLVKSNMDLSFIDKNNDPTLQNFKSCQNSYDSLWMQFFTIFIKHHGSFEQVHQSFLNSTDSLSPLNYAQFGSKDSLQKLFKSLADILVRLSSPIH